MEQPTTQVEHKSRSVAGHDDGPVNKYFSIVPHIDDDDLDLYEYRLLGHYRKLFGLGLPPETNSQTAIVTGMSVKAVRAARARLVVKKRITINELTGVVVLVSLMDVMAENVRRYTNNPSPKWQGYPMTDPYPKRKGGYAQKGRGGMPKKEGVTPDEPSSDADKTPPKELEEEKTPEDSFTNVQESRASAQSASHGTPEPQSGKSPNGEGGKQSVPQSNVLDGTKQFAVLEKGKPFAWLNDRAAQKLGAAFREEEAETTPSPTPSPTAPAFDRREVAAPLARKAQQLDDVPGADFEAMLERKAHEPLTERKTLPAARSTLDPAPVGHEWWFAGDDANTAHLLKGGKGKPLCKPKHWKFPNKCPNFQLFATCPDCVRIAAEPKAERKASKDQVLKDAIAVNIQAIAVDMATSLTGTLSGKAGGVWRKKLKRDLSAEDYEKIARSFDKDNERSFIAWFRVTCVGCDLPLNPETFESRYTQFVTWLDSGLAMPKPKTKTNEPDKPKQLWQMTQEELEEHYKKGSRRDGR